MGSLADALEEETPRSTQVCGVLLVLDQLDEEDGQALEAKLKGREVRPGKWLGIEATRIVQILKDRGIDVDANALRRHRATLRGKQGGCSTCQD